MTQCTGLHGTCKKKPKYGENVCSLHKNYGECSVCLDDIIGNSKYITQCGHKFHKKCAKKWFFENNTCPCCRQKLDTKFTKNHIIRFHIHYGNERCLENAELYIPHMEWNPYKEGWEHAIRYIMKSLEDINIKEGIIIEIDNVWISSHNS